jgi:hypothetical protein
MAADRFCRRIGEIRRSIFSVHKNKGLYSLSCPHGRIMVFKKMDNGIAACCCMALFIFIAFFIEAFDE